MSKKIKVTVCPPAAQDVFFQEQQFDDALGAGTDPMPYWRGSLPSQKAKTAPAYGNAVKKDRLKKAEKALDGHENKEAILKILRTE